LNLLLLSALINIVTFEEEEKVSGPVIGIDLGTT